VEESAVRIHRGNNHHDGSAEESARDSEYEGYSREEVGGAYRSRQWEDILDDLVNETGKDHDMRAVPLGFESRKKMRRVLNDIAVGNAYVRSTGYPRAFELAAVKFIDRKLQITGRLKLDETVAPTSTKIRARIHIPWRNSPFTVTIPGSFGVHHIKPRSTCEIFEILKARTV
jgi:hypothetical protein